MTPLLQERGLVRTKKTLEILAFPELFTISSLSHDLKEIEFGMISVSPSFVPGPLGRMTMVGMRQRTYSTMSKSWSYRIGQKTVAPGVQKRRKLRKCARLNTRRQ